MIVKKKKTTFHWHDPNPNGEQFNVEKSIQTWQLKVFQKEPAVYGIAPKNQNFDIR